MITSVVGFMRSHYFVTSILASAVLLAASVALANIVSGNVSTNSSSHITYTQVVVDGPASVATGDLLLANIAINGGSPANVTAPSGWTQVLRTDNDTNVSLISYYKVAGASEPANYTWTIDTATRAEGGITQYTGVDTSNPIDVALGNFNRGKVATTSSITTSSANEEVVDSFAFDAGTSTTGYFSTPTGMTEKYDVTFPTVGPSLAADDTVQVSAGTVGSVSTTIAGNKNRNWASQAIALRMAPTNLISIETGTNGSTSYAACISTFQSSYTFSKSVSATSTLLTVHTDSPLGTTVTYDGVSMTLATSSPGGLAVYYLVNPPSGTHDVVVTLPFAGGGHFSAVSYTGTDTTNPLGAIAMSSGPSGDTSVSITTLKDNSDIDDSIFYDYGQSLTANSPQIQQAAVQCGGVGGNSSAGASVLQTTAHGSNTLGWTHGGTSSDWMEIAVEINATP